MKRMAFALLLTLFCLIVTERNDTAIYHAKAELQQTSDSIEDKGRTDIAVLADILHDCSLELPQGGRIQYQRQDEQTSQRRPSCNNKTIDNSATLQSKHIRSYQLQERFKHIAAFRHNKGYYIYALRHIII